MKIFGFIISLVITVGLILALNNSIGVLPPLGKMLDPFKGIWQNARAEGIENSTYNLKGLKNEVSVVYDDRLVPHVFARNDEDLYFMQGYITARHRLWQMEFQTHAAAGRIAELIGEKALEYDMRQRRIGMLQAAKISESAMMSDPKSAAMVTSFTDGVNAFIGELKPGKFPFEYKLLNYSPEKWTPLKTALLLKYMANMLSGYENDLEYTNALLLFGEENAKILYPDYYPGQEPIIPAGTNFLHNNQDINEKDTLKKSPLIYNILKDKPDPDNGSNNWAVAGSKTASGKPLLCNDPHLGLNLPAIWFEIQLSAPDINCYGVSIPGAPGIIIGFNDSIAWGVTNSERDVRDWYKIVFKDKNRDEYLYNNEWRRTEKIIEEIKIKGRETVFDTVIYTHFGPVVDEPEFVADTIHRKQHYALKWQAHQPSNEGLTFYNLNRASNYEDYVEALIHYESPAQNFVFASSTGDIAIWNQGKYSSKKSGQGKFLLDGTTSDDEWNDYIPQQENPHIKNPERGFVSSANQHPTDTTYPYYYSGVFEYFRNRRINNVLRELKKITPQDMMKLQNDNYNLLASEVLPFMLQNVNEADLSESEKEIINELSKWNFFNDHHLVAPAYFEVWWLQLNEFLWDELKSDSVTLIYPTAATTSLLLVNDPENIFMDIKNTPEKEVAVDLINVSFRTATDSILIWKNRDKNPFNWHYLKGTRINHLARLES
ncbi:MAG: penicillin acylase family protein, partial [Bacteroidia bacterium]